ncbi:MAG: fimbrillin family protein [Bacteroides sp.]|nr:fimbrillin family protein [Bacteroides sp.]
MRILYRFLACFLFISILFVSCNEQNDVQNTDKPGEITFVSAVSKHATRLSQDGGQWTAGDQIGIYMTQSGQTAAIHYSNIPYTAESSAQATVFKADATTLYYPEEESPVDFIAYYPYASQIADWIYPIDLTDQSASLVAHDLMYAKADNGGNGFTSESISLGFTHQLSKLILNLVDENGDALVPDPNGVLVKGMHTTARFDLETGTLSDVATTADITPYQHGNSSEAILLPCSIGAEHQVIILVDGHQYLWEMSNNYSGLEMKAGYSYTFKMTVKTSESEIEAVLVDYNGSSLTPWGDGGADNQEEVPVDDIEIPTDYQTITLPSGGSINSALASATASKVAIVLADGGSYTESSTFSIPASITSLMIVGEGGTRAPSVYFGGSMVATEDMDLIHIYNLDLNGPGTGSGYFMNQASLVTIGQVAIESCAIHDIRGGGPLADSRVYHSLLQNNKQHYLSYRKL